MKNFRNIYFNLSRIILYCISFIYTVDVALSVFEARLFPAD